MSRISSNIEYKIRSQFPWIFGYVGIYLACMSLVYLILIKIDYINYFTGSLSYRLWGLVILQFAFSIRFKEDFDLFLTLSNTRTQIFKFLIGYSVIFSGVISLIILLERILIDYLNKILVLTRVKDLFHYLAPYYQDSLILQFVFFFFLGLCCASFGLLIGSLMYRLGKKFTLTFWLIFSTSIVTLLSFLIWPANDQIVLSDGLSSLNKSLSSINMPLTIVIMLVLMIVFSLCAYLNIRKLPQK
jgi:hypothetical protein